MADSLRGREYPPERKFFNDEKTGVRITKLTAFPTVNSKFYFHINQFTPDGKALVFRSYRSCERSSGQDIFRVNVDGRGLVQVTDNPNMTGEILSNSGKYLYYMDGGTLMRVDMDTYEETEISHIEGVRGPSGCSSLTNDDKWLYLETEMDDGGKAVLGYATDGSEAGVVFRHPVITHTQVEPAHGEVIAIQCETDENHCNIWLVNRDGTNFRPLKLPYGNGHWMWIGDTGRIMSNLDSDHWGISSYKEGDSEVVPIVSDGCHFWHASCSRDGKWAVSDTNWPDEGLQLISMETGRHETICYPGSSCGHPQWSHPHPSFSPDNKYVVFNSDVSGIPSIYLAEIPEDMYQRLS